MGTMAFPTAAEILERTQALYATCRTYADEGQAIRKNGIHSASATFRTAFTRRGRVRFDCTAGEGDCGSGSQACLVAEHGDARVWTRLPHSTSTREGRIFFELTRLGAVSSGSSKRIPALLLPLVGWPQPLPEPTSATLVGVEELGGIDCYRIEGTSDDGRDSIVAWIDSSMALRQLHTRRETTPEAWIAEVEAMRPSKRDPLTPDSNREQLFDLLFGHSLAHPPTSTTVLVTTTRWVPRFDVDIDPATFGFTPPE